MAADKFKHAEEEYFKLRGQFDTKRITQEQFDEKLRALMVQDEQGRYWMLGADSGKWYYYDGAKWVQGDPYPGASMPPPLAAPSEMHPVSSPDAARAPVSAPPARGQRNLLLPILIVVAVLLLGIGALLVFQNRERIFVAQKPPQITPILPPTITRAPSPTAQIIVPTAPASTLAPLPTAIPATDVPTIAPPTLAPTQIPATSVPAVTVIVVTSIAPTIEALPTFLPSATASSTPQPTIAITAVRPTATRAPPTNTSVPTCPNGVCVTKIEYSPAAPKRNQDATFTATFINSTGSPATYNWLILFYDPNKSGNNKGFGESPATDISIPVGESKFSVTYAPVKGPGPCINLYMRAGWKVSPSDKPIFPNLSGEPATTSFDVCP